VPWQSRKSRTRTAQSDDQPDDKANNETKRRQRKKDQHSAPTFEIRDPRRRITLREFGGTLAKKRKSVAQSKLRTTTYVEVLACYRSDSGRIKFSNVRDAGSQGNV